MGKGRYPVAIRDRGIGTGLEQQAQDLLVVGAAIAQHHGLHERRPSEIVDMVERGTGRDQAADHLDTPEMRSIGHKGYENVAADRAGVTRAFTSPRVKEAVARRKIKLISYADLAPDAPRP